MIWQGTQKMGLNRKTWHEHWQWLQHTNKLKKRPYMQCMLLATLPHTLQLVPSTAVPDCHTTSGERNGCVCKCSMWICSDGSVVPYLKSSLQLFRLACPLLYIHTCSPWPLASGLFHLQPWIGASRRGSRWWATCGLSSVISLMVRSMGLWSVMARHDGIHDVYNDSCRT